MRICVSNDTERDVLQCVFYGMISTGLVTIKGYKQAHLICRARCSLRVKLSWHGGKSVQKNRWPFFFFFGLCESLVTLSLSDSSSPSSSSAISMSPESLDACECVERCDSSRRRPEDGVCASLSCDGEKGVSGSARWPGMPPKSCLVGVIGFVVSDEASLTN